MELLIIWLAMPGNKCNISSISKEIKITDYTKPDGVSCDMARDMTAMVTCRARATGYGYCQ